MAKCKFRWLVILLTVPALFAQAPPTYDVLIKGGRILDGAGNPWVFGNVAISGERIARIGRFEADARRVIDATGLFVSPGFIDIMDQSGGALRADGKAQSKVRQGVTTGIGGEGGTPGPADQLDKYFATVLQQGISMNFGTFVSAAQARMAVLGSADREPNTEELERMKAVIAAGMQRGALGMTSALGYPLCAGQRHPGDRRRRAHRGDAGANHLGAAVQTPCERTGRVQERRLERISRSRYGRSRKARPSLERACFRRIGGGETKYPLNSLRGKAVQ